VPELSLAMSCESDPIPLPLESVVPPPDVASYIGNTSIAAFGPKTSTPVGSSEQFETDVNCSKVISFSELMPTSKIVKKTVKATRKSLNYTANCVRKLFLAERGKGKHMHQKSFDNGNKNTERKHKKGSDKLKPKSSVRNATGNANVGKLNGREQSKEQPVQKSSVTKRKRKRKLKSQSNKRAKRAKLAEKEPSVNETWFCSVCKRDVKLNMIRCAECETWVHNECVGLESDDDTQYFACPDCDNSD